MSRVKGTDTSIEQLLRSRLHRAGYRFRKHVKSLPGAPDMVFPRCRVVVFIDGDFWHGYRFPAWNKPLSEYWRNKILVNRKRDRRNFRRLRRAGWKVIRVWEHSVLQDLDAVVARVIEVLKAEGHRM